MSAITPIYGHTTEATAYMVNDYPYGRKVRCRIRYWLESGGKRGWRFVSQTENPRTGQWNKPKKSTYALFAAGMFLDEQGHVHWQGIDRGDKPETVLAFVRTFTEADVSRIRQIADEHIRLLAGLISGKAYFTVNGVRQPRTDAQNERDSAELAAWEQVLVWSKKGVTLEL